MFQICERGHEHDRPAGHPAVLHVLGLVPGDGDRHRERRADKVPVRDEKNCPDIQDHEDTEDIQAGETHNRTANTGNDTEKQVDKNETNKVLNSI